MHILIATDLSSRADMALQRGFEIADAADAACTIVHVAENEASDPAHELESQCRRIAAAFDISYDTVVQRGHVDEAVNALARERQSALIVIGAHQRRILGDVFADTTADKILRGSHVPVLMVCKSPYEDYDSVVFGIDYDTSSQIAVNTLFDLGIVDQARLTAVHGYVDLGTRQMQRAGTGDENVRQQKVKTKAEMAEMLYGVLAETRMADANYNLILDKADPADFIIRSATELEADLIVVGTRSKNRVERALLGSVAGQVLHRAPCDVLAVPPVPPV